MTIDERSHPSHAQDHRGAEARTKRDLTPFAFAPARGDDGSSLQWELFAFPETLRAKILRLKPGAAVTIRGAVVIRLHNGGIVAQVNVEACTRPSKPKAPRAKSPRQSGHRGTRKATASGVAVANLAFARKHCA